jgi:hypothetical protein
MTRAKFQKRLGPPAPLPTMGTLPLGCLLPLLAPAVLALLLVHHGRWALGLGVGALVVALAAPWLAGRARVRSAIADLRAAGKRGVLVYSDSPVWGPYIAHRWLPRVGPGFEVLNWSARASWPDSPAVRLWRQLTGRRRFNPVVILLQDGGPPLLYAFYGWFQAAKHGERAGLEALEADLFAKLGK